MPEPVRYRKEETQSGTGMLRYRIKCRNANAAGISLDPDAQLDFPAVKIVKEDV